MGGLTLSANTTAAVTVTLDGTANLGVTGAIVNGQSFANGVVIKGTGAKTFSGANTYTGETEIVSGATLNYGAKDVTLDTGGRMYVNGGTLNIGSYTDTVSSVRVNAGGAINGTGTLTTTGGFTLADNNTVNANLAGATMTLSKIGVGFESLLNGNNTYGGATSVSSGTLKLGSNTALGSTAGGTSVSSGGFLDLNGRTVGAEALTFTGTGGLLNSSALAASQSGTVAVGDFTTVNTSGDITLSGNLTGIASKSLTKEGTGILKLSSSGSTLAGTLKVSAGTLLVTGNGNVSTSSSIVNGGTLRVNGTAGGVTVNAGGILEGSGTVGTTTVAGTLTPGNSPGVLSVNGNLTMASGGNMVWELFANNATQASPAVFDQVLVSGNLAFAGSNGITLNFGTALDGSTVSWSDSFWNSNQSFLIYDVAGSTTGFSNLSLLNTSFNDATGAALAASKGSFSVSQLGSDVFLNYNVIPEPSTGSMLGLGLAGLVATRLLRRKISLPSQRRQGSSLWASPQGIHSFCDPKFLPKSSALFSSGRFRLGRNKYP
jgi:autotransporter-associated beta strand protein